MKEYTLTFRYGYQTTHRQTTPTQTSKQTLFPSCYDVRNEVTIQGEWGRWKIFALGGGADAYNVEKKGTTNQTSAVVVRPR